MMAAVFHGLEVNLVGQGRRSAASGPRHKLVAGAVVGHGRIRRAVASGRSVIEHANVGIVAIKGIAARNLRNGTAEPMPMVETLGFRSQRR